jgi:hypothetical protein
MVTGAGNKITVGTFVGALLGETTRARAIGDRASLYVAEQYLQNDLLRGFSVPRMQIRDLEVDLNFAVASKLRGAFFLEDEEVQKYIGYQMRDFLGSLPAHRDFSAYFRDDAELAARWASGLDETTRCFRRIVSKPEADAASAIHSLSLSVQNYFYESAPAGLRLGLFSLLNRPIGKGGRPDSMKTIIEERVRTIITSAGASKPEESSELPLNLEILVGAAQLEKLNPCVLSKIKLTLSSADRRWVASDQDGKKVYILST